MQATDLPAGFGGAAIRAAHADVALDLVTETRGPVSIVGRAERLDGRPATLVDELPYVLVGAVHDDSAPARHRS